MSNIDYSIIIPAYNEERRILSTLAGYYSFLRQLQNKTFEIIVSVNSPDRTINIVKSFSQNKQEIKILNTTEPLGKGGAIIKGFEEASGRLIGFIDADESVKPEDFYKLIITIEENRSRGIVGAIASRYVRTSIVLKQEGFIKRVLSRILNKLLRILFGLKFNDTQCGAKIFYNQYVKNILPFFKTHGYEFDVELLWRIQDYGRVEEIGVTWEAKGNSTFKIWFSFAMLYNLLKLRFNNKK